MDKLTLGLLAGASLGFVAAVSFSGVAEDASNQVRRLFDSHPEGYAAPSSRAPEVVTIGPWVVGPSARATGQDEDWVPTTVAVYGKSTREVIAVYELKTGRFVYADTVRGPEGFIAAVTWAAGKTCSMVEKRPVVPELPPVPGVRRGPLERLAQDVR